MGRVRGGQSENIQERLEVSFSIDIQGSKAPRAIREAPESILLTSLHLFVVTDLHNYVLGRCYQGFEPGYTRHHLLELAVLRFDHR